MSPIPADDAFLPGEEPVRRVLVRLIAGHRSALEELSHRRTEADDLPYWAAVARADAAPRLVMWFSPTSGWAYEPRQSGLIGEEGFFGVRWSFGGRHDKPGFNGLPPSGRTVDVRGFTLFGPGGEDFQDFKFHRFVDWVGLYAQLGLTLNWRIPLPASPLGDAVEDQSTTVIRPGSEEPPGPSTGWTAERS